jgi:hypothetical protein
MRILNDSNSLQGFFDRLAKVWRGVAEAGLMRNSVAGFVYLLTRQLRQGRHEASPTNKELCEKFLTLELGNLGKSDTRY